VACRGQADSGEDALCLEVGDGSSGSSFSPGKPRSVRAPRATSRRWAVILLWRAQTRVGSATGVRSDRLVHCLWQLGPLAVVGLLAGAVNAVAGGAR
jgi:hypothetical protein